MQEEINQRTIAICIKGTKITARMLKAAMRGVLRLMKNRGKNSCIAGGKVVSRGKQSLKHLQGQGYELTNIEITDENIGSFKKYARKYGIDFSLKKNSAATPPRFYVFFKARDAKTMEAAFKEYTAHSLMKKPSIREKLQNIVAKSLPHRERERHRDKERSTTL